MSKMNPMQAAIAKIHGEGDFAHLADDPNWREEIKTCGDILFQFMMFEVDEDVEGDVHEAVRRLMRATSQILAAIEIIMAMAPEEEEETTPAG